MRFYIFNINIIYDLYIYDLCKNINYSVNVLNIWYIINKIYVKSYMNYYYNL